MSYDYKGSADLVWEPTQQIRTFPSGLLLVQRTAMIRKDRAAIARQELLPNFILPCDSPAIDEVRIFPEPQESEDNGFIRFLVSGYGRTNTEGKITKLSEVIVLNGVNYVSPILRREYVVAAGQEIQFSVPISPPDVTQDKFRVIRADNNTDFFFDIKTLLGPDEIEVITYQLRGVERTNYGLFDEVIEVWGQAVV